MKAFGSVAARTVPTVVGIDVPEDCAPVGRHPDDPPAAAAMPALRNVQILIVDDCVLNRNSLYAALAANGTPADGCAWDLITLASALRTVPGGLMLLNIATRNSTALLRTALATDPGVRVVVLGVCDDDDDGIIQCAEAGAAGYHTRTQSFEDLLVVMGNVAAGEPSCSAWVSSILLRRLAALGSQRQPDVHEMALTARELQIFGLLELGMSNREIAAELCIAVHTVKNHVHSLLTKLGVRTRAEAAALAHPARQGFTAPTAIAAS
jgi:DNA-binding NarL/FixJ family response regulator